jgi:hypothetical protein
MFTLKNVQFKKCSNFKMIRILNIIAMEVVVEACSPWRWWRSEHGVVHFVEVGATGCGKGNVAASRLHIVSVLCA